MEPPKGYQFALDMAKGSIACGDRKFAEVASGVAIDLMKRRLHKPKREDARG